MKKRIFISFDYDHDKNYRFLLDAWAKNDQFEIDFYNATPSEIQSYDVSRIKAVLTQKIRAATHTLVIIGKYANSFHHKASEIGERNWQWWEIKKSISEKKSLIAVKIELSNETPDPLLNAGATWARSYNADAIERVIG